MRVNMSDKGVNFRKSVDGNVKESNASVDLDNYEIHNSQNEEIAYQRQMAKEELISKYALSDDEAEKALKEIELRVINNKVNEYSPMEKEEILASKRQEAEKLEIERQKANAKIQDISNKDNSKMDSERERLLKGNGEFDIVITPIHADESLNLKADVLEENLQDFSVEENEEVVEDNLQDFSVEENEEFVEEDVLDSSLVDDVDSGVDDVLDSSLVDDVDSGVDDVLDSSLDADVDSSGGEIEESVEESVPDSSIEEDENDDFKATDVDSLISNLIGEELEDDSADDSETGSELETENSDSQSTSAEKSNDVDSLISDIIHEEDRELSVVVNNVSLSFDVANDKIDNLKELFIRTLKRNKAEKQRFQALKNISFEIYKGEKIGVIGYNGAGKSTLLNVITGIYPPEEGTVETYGKISPLLALGAGFDHNYSGRENIYLNGAVLGYSKEFLQSKFDEIVEFSELEDFIDFPIKNYSSGMLAKLGFSIATIVEPDILIIDEVLGVGDVNFQKKSSDKIRSLMDSGTTVILVSHSIPQIRQLCDKAIWIDQGRVREIGEVNEVCNNYLKDAEKADKEQLKNIRFR